jgi:hypothetical protein
MGTCPPSPAVDLQSAPTARGCPGRRRSMGLAVQLLPAVPSWPACEGAAETFEIPRAEFAAAWKDHLPKCTEANFEEYRRQEAWTAWKYAMHDASLKLPTQFFGRPGSLFLWRHDRYHRHRVPRLRRSHVSGHSKVQYRCSRRRDRATMVCWRKLRPLRRRASLMRYLQTQRSLDSKAASVGGLF